MALIYNQNKSNTGKKYLQKSKIDSVYAKKAEAFNSWFSNNSGRLEKYFTTRYLFDYDVYSDCFLKVYENILFSGIEIESYEKYFKSSYYKILANDKELQNRYCEILPNHDKEDIDNEYFEELEEKSKSLEVDIMDYVYSKYDLHEYEIFKMYVNLKPAINYKAIATITNLKYHHIQTIVAKIKIDIQENKEFSKRRKEVV